MYCTSLIFKDSFYNEALGYNTPGSPNFFNNYLYPTAIGNIPLNNMFILKDILVNNTSLRLFFDEATFINNTFTKVIPGTFGTDAPIFYIGGTARSGSIYKPIHEQEVTFDTSTDTLTINLPDIISGTIYYCIVSLAN